MVISAFSDLARRRRMTRHFLPDPVDDELLVRVLDTARRVPSAGNAQGFDFVVLCGADETARYWDTTLPTARRDGFRWTSLLACPVLVTVWADPSAYVQRYGESDKERSGLGAGADAWQTPYWTVDAAFAALALQYAAIDEGLGVLFFGMFEHDSAVAAALGVPQTHEPIGVVALGWPNRDAEAASNPAASQNRPRRPFLRAEQSETRTGRNAAQCSTAGDGGVRSSATEGSGADRPVVHRGRWMGHW